MWGTDFMLQFYNDLERTHPYADNVKPMQTVVWHGLRNGWLGARELVRLFVFLKRRGIPWAGLATSLLDEPVPLTPAAAAAAFDDPAWRQAVLDRARQDPAGFKAELDAAVAELEPDERRLATAPAKVELDTDGATGAAPAPSATLGLFREDRELRAGRDRLAAPGVTHVVFGHTHDIVDGELGGRLFNYGTWLPSLNLKDAHVRAKIEAHGLTLDVLKDRSLYAVERRAVRIDADPSGYAAQVRLVSDEEP